MKFKIGQRIVVRQKVNETGDNYEPDIRDKGKVTRVMEDQIYVEFDSGSHVHGWFFYDCSKRSRFHEEDNLNECYCMLKSQYKWEDL